MSTFQRNATDLFLAPQTRLPCDHPLCVSSLTLSLSNLTVRLFFTLLSYPFVAQFHLAVSCQLSRKRWARGKNSGDGGAKEGGREGKNSLRGILVSTRHYLAPRERGNERKREQPPLMMLLHRRDFWRETKNITPYNRGVRAPGTNYFCGKKQRNSIFARRGEGLSNFAGSLHVKREREKREREREHHGW